MPDYPPPLTDAEIDERLSRLSGWQREGDSIQKTYRFDRYLSGIAFASAVGIIAEGLDHHPDMRIGWRRVTVTYNTHAVGNKITIKDFEAAEAIEALPYKSR